MEGFEKPKMRPVSEVLDREGKVEAAEKSVVNEFKERIPKAQEKVMNNLYFEIERSF